MTENNVIHNALGSATANIVSRIITHPLDTAKARLQAPSSIPYTGTINVITRTIQSEGFGALYRGFGAILVGGTPGTMLYLCSYDWIKHGITNWSQQQQSHNNNTNHEGTSRFAIPEFAIHFTSGMMAETIACLVYVPVDVTKERLQVQERIISLHSKHQSQIIRQPNYYTGSLDALKKILKYEGLSGIYKGYLATLTSFGPFSALYFVFYEKMKSESVKYLNTTENNIPFPYLVMSSATSGAAASWLTSPLDMAKLRLQIQRGNQASAGTNNVVNSNSEHVSSNNNNSRTKSYRGMLDCLVHIYKENGVKGLFRGAGARVIHFAPATTITMTCYEKCRSFYADNILYSK